MAIGGERKIQTMAPETTDKSQYGDDVKSNKTAEVVC